MEHLSGVTQTLEPVTVEDKMPKSAENKDFVGHLRAIWHYMYQHEEICSYMLGLMLLVH